MRITSRPLNQRTSRHGITLIEMVVVISVMGVLMSLGIVLLGLLLRADSAGNEALATQLSISRLERQFRADAHHAVAAAPSDDAQTLNVELSDGRHVVWSVSAAGIARQASDGASVTARDDYRLADGESRFSVDSSGRLVELRRRYGLATPTESPVNETAASAHEWHIQAAVGIAVVRPAPAAVSDAETEP